TSIASGLPTVAETSPGTAKGLVDGVVIDVANAAPAVARQTNAPTSATRPRRDMFRRRIALLGRTDTRRGRSPRIQAAQKEETSYCQKHFGAASSAVHLRMWSFTFGRTLESVGIPGTPSDRDNGAPSSGAPSEEPGDVCPRRDLNPHALA